MGSVAVVSVGEVYVDDEVGDIPNWWYDWKVGDVSRMFVSGQDGDIFITNSIINSGAPLCPSPGQLSLNYII